MKRGDVAGISGEVYESDQVRLSAQAMVLRENGFLCEAGMAYFCKSRKFVPVQFDEPLFARTEEIIAWIRAMAADRKMPLPLLDSPKCNRCAFGGICLPDEVNFLRDLGQGSAKELRMLVETIGRMKNSRLSRFYQRLAKKKEPNVATIAVARKLICLIFHLEKGW